MTTEAPERVAAPTSQPRHRPGRTVPAVLAVLALAAVLVAGAGAGHPWGPGSPLTPGEYTRGYAVTQQHWSPRLERCVKVTIGGNLYGTWTDPAWNLRGAGWTRVRLTHVTTTTSVTADCSERSAPAEDTHLRAAQYWATEDCAKPVTRDSGWAASAGDSANCPKNRVLGIGPLATDPGGDDLGTPAAESTESFGGELTWKGTNHSEAACVTATVGVDLTTGSKSDAFTLEGFLVCLAPDSVVNPTA